MSIINIASFPLTVDVVLGPAWDGHLSLSENDVVTLTKISTTSTLVRYSEDGTATPNTSTNRILIEMRAGGTVSLGATASLYAFYARTGTISTFSPVGNLSPSFPANNILGQIATMSPYSYTFREVFADNTQYTSQSTITVTNDGWPKVFKSMQEGPGPEAILTGTGTVTAASQVEHPGDATIQGTGTVNPLGGLLLTGDTDLAGTGTVIVAGQIEKLADADLAGTGTVTVDGLVDHNANADLQGTGAIVAAGSGDKPGTASLNGSGDITPFGGLLLEGIAPLSGTGVIVATGRRITTGVANLSGAGSVVGDATITIPTYFAGTGTLVAFATVIPAPIDLQGGSRQLAPPPKPRLSYVVQGALIPQITVNAMPDQQRQRLRSDANPSAPLAGR